MMSNRIYRIIILIILLYNPGEIYSESGKLIYIYGISCSGKSSLSRELKNNLPENFVIIKKSPLYTHIQMKHKDAELASFLFIEQLLKQGIHVIFDICSTSNQIPIQIPSENVVRVLVYAPLDTILNRLEERIKLKDLTPEEISLQKQKLRRHFSSLYKETSEDKSTIDSINGRLIRIRTRSKPDLFIDTTKETTEISIKKIENYIKKAPKKL